MDGLVQILFHPSGLLQKKLYFQILNRTSPLNLQGQQD